MTGPAGVYLIYEPPAWGSPDPYLYLQPRGSWKPQASTARRFPSSEAASAFKKQHPELFRGRGYTEAWLHYVYGERVVPRSCHV